MSILDPLDSTTYKCGCYVTGSLYYRCPTHSSTPPHSGTGTPWIADKFELPHHVPPSSVRGGTDQLARDPLAPWIVGKIELPQTGYQTTVSPVIAAVMLRVARAETTAAELAIALDLLWKFSRGDWHGVSDAANDLRVLEAIER